MFLYNLTDKNGIKNCLEENGVVGILNVLNKEEIQKTINCIELLIQKECKSDNFKFNNYDSYSLTDNLMNNYGVIGKQALFEDQLIKNRYNPNIQEAYSIAYNLDKNEIFPHHDRVGWMRPTIGPNSEDWSKYKVPFNKPGLHLDISPNGYFDPKYSQNVYQFLNNLEYKNIEDLIRENNAKNIIMGKHYTGVLNLLDNEEEDGGFHCILGGHKIVEEWYKNSKNLLPKAEPNGRYIINFDNSADLKYFNEPTTRIICPAGTLLIFDITLPHGTKPNYSNNSRLIQFLKYSPINMFNKKTFLKRENFLIKIYSKLNPFL